jgi:hypothetical protein
MGHHRVFHFVNWLLLILLVSTASEEHAFSTLNIIKTRLRNKMEDDFLTNNMPVHMEVEVMEDYNYEDIIDDFNDVKKRRAGFKCVYYIQELYFDINIFVY